MLRVDLDKIKYFRFHVFNASIVFSYFQVSTWSVELHKTYSCCPRFADISKHLVWIALQTVRESVDRWDSEMTGGDFDFAVVRSLLSTAADRSPFSDLSHRL